MKISLNLVKKFIDLGDLPVQQIADQVHTQIGEVDGVQYLGDKYRNIIIGEILNVQDHPEADKLNVHKVAISQSEEVVVVAGDKTLQVGDKVAYIPPGTVVPSTHGTPEEFKIAKREIRGIESNGMMASEAELDFGDDHSGVMTLPVELEVGAQLIDIYELDDVIIEVDPKAVTNRPDLFGHLGIAREFAGMFNLDFSSPQWYNQLNLVMPDSLPEVKIDNQVPDHCNRYSAITISNTQVSKSPLVIQSYLNRLGVKSINNIVDITNYIAITTAQPMHAYDMDKIVAKSGSSQIIVRKAIEGETITCLNDKTYELSTEDLVIADKSGPIGIAGVIGGRDTEVDENTKTVMFEAANFNMYTIRRTSMRHGIFTDAVTRFSKGQDPDKCDKAITEAVRMAEQLSGSQVVSELTSDYPIVREHRTVTALSSFINLKLGTNLPTSEMVNILNKVELSTIVINEGQEDETLQVTVPTHRNDIHIQEDLSEEIGRLHGYHNIPLTIPATTVAPVQIDKMLQLKLDISDLLASSGANQLLTYNFISSKLYEKLNLDLSNSFRIKNSISPELEYMRPHIMPSLLEKLAMNSRKNYSRFTLFEANKTHSKHEMIQGDNIPVEKNKLAITFTNSDKKSVASPFYDIKFYINQIATQYSLDLEYEIITPESEVELEHDIQKIFESNRSAKIYAHGVGERVLIGFLGELSQKVINNFKLNKNSCAAEIYLDELNEIIQVKKASNYKPVSRYQGSSFDITYELNLNDEVADLLAKINNHSIEMQEQVKFNCTYIFNSEGEDIKKVTIHFEVSDSSQTINSQRIQEIINIFEKI